MSSKSKIGVLGASGYTGSELVRLLLRHPQVDIALLTADRRAGQEMREVFPQFSPFVLPKLVSIEAVDWRASGLDLIFCALPHATTQKVVKALLAAAPHTKVVDLSADFRLADTAAYARWYGHEHHAPDLQKEAVYGLVEVHREAIKSARLVANPGCYTTCAQLAAGAAAQGQGDRSRRDRDRRQVGHDRRGQGGEGGMLFSEVSEGFHAYGVGHHRHMAELDQEFSLAAGREVVVTFTPHLVPMNRGILSTIYVRGLGRSPQDLHAILAERLCERAVRACAAVRRDAADAACARLQHDLYRRRPGSHAGPGDRLLGARQSGQGRVRAGGAEHESDARLSRGGGARAGRTVSLKLAFRLGGLCRTSGVALRGGRRVGLTAQGASFIKIPPGGLMPRNVG